MEQAKVRRRQLAFRRMSTHEVHFCFSFDGTEDQNRLGRYSDCLYGNPHQNYRKN